MEMLKKFVESNKKKVDIFIFGHLHKPKHNIDDKMLIVGAFKTGHLRYICIENGEIKFVDEEY
jgi:predicted phosphodiesterase